MGRDWWSPTGTLREGRVLPWPAGRRSRTLWTTRFLQLRASTQLCMGTKRTQRRFSPTPTSVTCRQVASLAATTRDWALEATSSPLRGRQLPRLLSPMSLQGRRVTSALTAPTATASTALSRREAATPSAATALWRGRARTLRRRRREARQPGGLSGGGASLCSLEIFLVFDILPLTCDSRV